MNTVEQADEQLTRPWTEEEKQEDEDAFNYDWEKAIKENQEKTETEKIE